jgi:hypothetical protein
MDNITKVAQSIVNSLHKVTCITEELEPDQIHFITSDLVIGDDYSRNEWFVELVMEGKNHFEVQRSLIDLLGTPDRQSERGDLEDGKMVNNWTVNNVLIVQMDDTISLFEDYEKVSKKK